ncbi:uncharacterized protein LOC101737148 [Bombyx mori]|uniref:TIL domain-containing protein n=1 Tax=Bombyx mori TaxID=7091 RepID=A0A8R2AG46_BOMMO|nr:uncharacterized protein LOC101737148 [Bombyx mori]
MKVLWGIVLFSSFASKLIEGTALINKCGTNEVYKPCQFYEEYTCWTSSSKMERTRTLSKKFKHCVDGCYCDKGLVRSYSKGPCIEAGKCRDKKIEKILDNLPIYKKRIE